MFIKKQALVFLLPLIAIYVAAGCQDVPVTTEPDAEFATDKLSLDNADYLAEVDYHAAELGLGDIADLQPNDGTRRSDDKARHHARGHDGAVARAHATAAKYKRILATLQLRPEQRSRIARCFAQYRECVASTSERYRHARRQVYVDFRTKVERIRQALIDGDITRDGAKRLYKQCVKEYRIRVKRLVTAYHNAVADCLHELKRCIESVLTDAQLNRWHHLLDSSGDDSGRGRLR